MRQFDVHRFVGRSATVRPYLIIVQSNLFRRRERLLAIPLVLVSALDGQPEPQVNPTFVIEGQKVFLETFGLGSFPLAAFGPNVGTLEDQGDRIVAAIDLAMARGYD